MQTTVQQQVASTVGSSAAELTQGNAALGALVAQLDRLAGVPLAPGGSCEQPCLDLGQYAALHSRACVCMQQSFARLQRLAEEAARRSAWAIAGMLHAPCILSASFLLC
jgi:hypothetical protein